MNLGALKPQPICGHKAQRGCGRTINQTWRKFEDEIDISGATFFVILIHQDCSG